MRLDLGNRPCLRLTYAPIYSNVDLALPAGKDRGLCHPGTGITSVDDLPNGFYF